MSPKSSNPAASASQPTRTLRSSAPKRIAMIQTGKAARPATATAAGNAGKGKAKESELPPPPPRRLRNPLTKFQFTAPNTHPTRGEWEALKEKKGLTYEAGAEQRIGKMVWRVIPAFRGGDYFGSLLIPKVFYPLWRRLMWGATVFDTVWGVWEERKASSEARRDTKSVSKFIESARRNSAMRAVWYTQFRRQILRELLDIDFQAWSDDNPDANPDLPVFTEFGIREYRCWQWESFEDMVQEDGEKCFLESDPTAPENIEAFGKLRYIDFLERDYD